MTKKQHTPKAPKVKKIKTPKVKAPVEELPVETPVDERNFFQKIVDWFIG